MSVSSLAPNTSWSTAPATNQSKAPTPTANMSFANMSPKTGAPAPVAKPLVVSTSKPAEQHISTLGNNIQGQTQAINNQAAVKTGAQNFANDALTTQANKSGMTPQQMGQQAEQAMKDRVIQQSQQNPGQLQTGAQMGSLQTGTGQTPVTFQAMTQNNAPSTTPTAASSTASEGTVQTTGVAATTGATSGTGVDKDAPGFNNAKTQTADLTPDQQLASLDAQTDQAYNDYNAKIQSIQNGTFPLNPTQQATINSIMSTFSGLVASQKAANKNYTSAIGQANITSGRARYAPTIAAGEIQRSINAGIAKIAEIETKASAALVEAQTAFQKEDYAQATTAYEMLQKHLDAKTETLTKMMDATAKAASEARKQEFEMMKYQNEQQQQGLMNTLKFAEFDQKASKEAFDQIMESSKFSYQQKQDAVKNMIESDKFDYQQKKDAIDQALAQGKFDYQQIKDFKDYKLDIEKMERADKPESYKEWKLSGQPTTYGEWLRTEKANGKPATADQATTGILVNNMKLGNDTVDLMTNSYAKDLSTFDFLKQEKLPDSVKSQEFRRFEQGARAFVEGWLRRTSGAAISDGEWASAFKQFLPQAGDGPEVLAQKKRARQSVMSGMADAAGPAVSDSFKKQIQSGKTAYYTLQDYATANPDKEDEYNALKKAYPNATDDDFLKLLQEDGQDFNQPLSMGENGSNSGLGGLSAKYESSGNPGAIGYDSTGGLSYGTYQLAHNNAKKFVEQSPYAEEFKGIPFNSEAFKQKWREVAKQDPEGFKKAQHSFIENTHYTPQKAKLASIGIDLDNFSPAFKDVVFSTGVQHGANNNILTHVFKKMGKNASEENLVKEIYRERWSGGTRFASSTPAVRQSVYRRFFGKGGELNTALKQLKQYA